MQYVIQVDDDDREKEPDRPWSAAVHAVLPDGSREHLGTTFGATAQEAVSNAAMSRYAIDWGFKA